ncbi:spermidine/putrescine transport system ATP-binding protein [Pseudosulfitobacter pseudonitzschiae]|uniref:Spermidine/putrescine import ATP-binding protein PotA n=1 Tax=Pseudosulfitobacter pseudonitzschiae TaxID=1402135 RepID=A0A073JBZ0_9RHOB|nr:ABC transporter ATP-binding protein [Pseudosulfitobacter pseudonitzschiae]KEJ95252.1 spermidine/putrescine ABC transporter ATP-binding protein [Pseudosulfitobacter pseudonitzschiae]QKS11498.1 ABC transporter ATP-binding protein [Pseudosulfitobacter pseudonitzschiae]SHF86702.1 spermidine/putrescine transport system ATP-binding protein [Pseudosulfitobacter pseudonitzschiae]
MLDIRSLSKKFGSGDSAFQALKSIDITIEEGEFFTLLGPSGCGKTTLLRLIAGFEQPSGGQLVLDGKDIATIPPNHRPVNTVFQSYALFPHMTVAQNVAFGLEARGTNPAEIAPRVDEILEIVQMAHLRDRKSSQMSGGQQQRVALARALAPRPRILLLDEPLSALDLKLRKQMQFELKRLQRELGLTFIFVTHDQDEALTMSDRIAVMDGGTLQQVADPRTLYDHPANRFVAEFIGEANFLSGTVAGGKLSLSGQAPVPLPHGADASGPVTVMIRPEQVVVGSAGGNAVTLDGQIEALVFSGTDTHVTLRLENGDTLSLRAPNNSHATTTFAEGEPLRVALPVDALRLLPEDIANAA